jgi:predicted dehydrogenase
MEPGMPLNCALIGCGGMGMSHLQRLESLEETHVSWVVDIREQALEAARQEYPSLSCTTDHREMLADDDVEAVSIATHIPTHHTLAMDCLNAGKHVLVEKPMTDSIENAVEMVEAARTNDVKLMVSQNYRWFSDVTAAKRLLDENDFGQLKFANLTFYQWMDAEALAPWREEPHLDRCVIFCHGVHLVDLLRHLTGTEAKSVSCLTQRTNPDFKGDTTALMLLELEGDTVRFD